MLSPLSFSHDLPLQLTTCKFVYQTELKNVATLGVVLSPDFIRSTYHFQHKTICTRVGFESGTETTLGLE